MFKHSIVKSKALSRLLRILLYLFLAALIAACFYTYYDGSWRELGDFYRYLLNPTRLREFITSFGPFAAVVFVLIQALQVVFAPIPGEMTGFVGGFLFGSVMGSVLSTIGLTLGSLAAFQIARIFGLKLVERVVKKEYIDKFNDFITHKGLYISYVLFLLPGFPKDSLCYLLGLTHVKFVDVLLMNLLGRLPGTVMLNFQGSAVKDARYTTFLVLLIVSVVVMVVLYFSRDHVLKLFSRILHVLVKKKEYARGEGKPVEHEDVERMAAEKTDEKPKAQDPENEGR